MEMKIATVVGARPQFIKAAVVSRALRRRQGVREILIHTGQHYDANMSDIFFDELDIPRPDHHLGVGSGTHGDQTGRMLAGLEARFIEDAPDIVVVFGDTNSTLAAALAAAKLSIPVAHVEAGLRSFNRRMPEEINRVLTDHLSRWCFAPTELAVTNLKHEGIAGDYISNVGDVMYDAALFYRERASTVALPDAVNRSEYVLCTIHRAENTDDPVRLRTIVEALARIAGEVPAAGLADALNHLHLLDPLGYLDMTAAEANARLIITDSGGVQKEAFFQGVSCVTLRDETEWIELVELGWNRVVPPASVEAITSAVTTALADRPAPVTHSPYGDGHAGEQIVNELLRFAPDEVRPDLHSVPSGK
jgi:UDP-GlcNAc3NAcA epimerase